jgi:SNF2 family DNA or RNA helicase
VVKGTYLPFVLVTRDLDMTSRLDLTAANHGFLLEPQWNPMLEEQALSRVHRLGQTKPVRLMRFVIRDTWEERIVKAQTKKKTLADLVVDRVQLKKGDAGRRQLQVRLSLSTQPIASDG